MVVPLPGPGAALVVARALVAALVALVLLAGPGLFVLRRSKWSAAEILAAAPGLSILIVGLVRFAIFVLDPGPWAGLALDAACLALLVAAVAHLARPGNGRGRDAFVGVLAPAALLAAWVAVLTSLVRNYGAGNWNTDWFEHYLRARFFLGGQPLGRDFVGAPLAGRPPLLNLFAAQVMGTAGAGYPQYQAAVGVAAVAGFFAVLLMACRFAAGRSGDDDGSGAAGLAPVTAGWLMFSPMFVENATYPWTKAVAAWMVVAATALYLRGRRAPGSGRTIVAFALGAGAILTHYSAAPYVLFIAAHWLARGLMTRRGRAFAREAATIGAVVAVVLAPWLLYAAIVSGPEFLFTSTASYRDAAAYENGSHLAKIALNIRDTIVPNFARGVSSDARSSLATWGGLRETAFMAYQSNLVLALGSAGLLLLAAAAGRARRGNGGARDADDAPFWIGFVAAGLVVGLAAHGARDQLGLAHLVLQPIVLVALAWLAAGFPGWPRAWRIVALAGLVLDFALGVALHFWLQSYPLDLPDGWHGALGLTLTDLSIGYTEANWLLKGPGVVFIGDALARLRPLMASAAVLLAVAGCALLVGASRRAGSQSRPRTSASSVATST